MTRSESKVATEYSHMIIDLFLKANKMKTQRLSRVIQVKASSNKSKINQCNVHNIFILSLLDHLVFYGLSFGSLHKTKFEDR